jgi:predicted dehydrogenase
MADLKRAWPEPAVGAGGSAGSAPTKLPLANGALAHIHVNWMSPTKIRQMVIGGSKRTLLWDDLNIVQRVSVFDRGVELIDPPADGEESAARRVAYRTGDTWSPELKERESLAGKVEEFAYSILAGRVPLTSGDSGLRILRVLEAASASMVDGGRLVDPGGGTMQVLGDLAGVSA